MSDFELGLISNKNAYIKAKLSGHRFNIYAQTSQQSETQSHGLTIPPRAAEVGRADLSADNLVPSYKPGYSLMFGTELFYYVMKMITTVYERLLKAKQLI